MQNYKSWEVIPVDKSAVQGIPAASATVRVFSPANIALAKYWGKRDLNLNLPLMGSISITLDNVGSFTTVEFDRNLEKDEFFLNKAQIHDACFNRVHETLSRLRALAQRSIYARVQSMNNFPTAAGLASSASGTSALVLAAAHALGLDLSLTKLSELARLGSGSACRSFFDGFVEWKKGEELNGSDSVADSILSSQKWPLKVFIVCVSKNEKSTSSRSAMLLTQQTSPYFNSWVESANKLLPSFRKAIGSQDFKTLAELSELSCMQMHACIMVSQPPLIYWTPATLEVIQLTQQMRLKKGIPVFYTIDAGANVVLICEPEAAHQVKKEIESFEFIKTAVGSGARIL